MLAGLPRAVLVTEGEVSAGPSCNLQPDQITLKPSNRRWTNRIYLNSGEKWLTADEFCCESFRQRFPAPP